MPQFDEEKMVRFISELRKSVTRLKNIAALPLNDFLKDQDKVGSAKYHFIVAIESAIDMCNHIIARNGFRAPDDYGDTFRVMEKEGAFEPDFSEDLRTMAKFRNRLVHLYWQIDDKLLYEILQTRLADFKKFLNAMARFLNWEGIHNI
ncbi:MAG: DUF86 domain-containing protein [Deltaproteobacteria bacterium]|nr:DUF86 domain-containing protein [Deltaproteobacteria bacterium]